MAFKSVANNTTNKEELPELGEPVIAKNMEEGASITGYFVGTSVKDNSFGSKNYNAILQDPKSGQRFMVFSVGTLKYDLMDKRLERGLLTRITSNGQDERTNNQTGRKYQIHSFTVEQDPDDSIDLSAEQELYKSSDEKKEDNRAAISEDVNKVLGKGGKKQKRA